MRTGENGGHLIKIKDSKQRFRFNSLEIRVLRSLLVSLFYHLTQDGALVESSAPSVNINLLYETRPVKRISRLNVLKSLKLSFCVA